MPLETKTATTAPKAIPRLGPIVLWPYSPFSKGGRLLSAALGVSFVKKGRGSMPDFTDKVVINWGMTVLADGVPHKVLNSPSAVALCSNKLSFFERVKGSVKIPEYTVDLSEALSWARDGHIVMGRMTRGSRGEDIVFLEDNAKRFSESEFFVKYKKKTDEYRIHIAFGSVISLQRKALRKTDPQGREIDTSDVDFRIRNLSNGFVFVRGDCNPGQEVLDQAVKAVSTVGLDFGAVDVIWNSQEGAFVLEVNTAPGLEGETILHYQKALAERLR